MRGSPVIRGSSGLDEHIPKAKGGRVMYIYAGHIWVEAGGQARSGLLVALEVVSRWLGGLLKGSSFA
jgi:hypothetical protein